MLPPIVCFSCGCSISEKAELFRYIRRQRMAKLLKKNGYREHSILPQQAQIDPNMQVDMEDIVTALGIKYLCCRIRISTALDWRDCYD